MQDQPNESPLLIPRAIERAGRAVCAARWTSEVAFDATHEALPAFLHYHATEGREALRRTLAHCGVLRHDQQNLIIDRLFGEADDRT
jgi:hypothetical protein